jgi:hypothetical protein
MVTDGAGKKIKKKNSSSVDAEGWNLWWFLRIRIEFE